MALFSNIQGLTLDTFGNLYIADTDNNVIRKITPDGIVTTYAGIRSSFGGYQDGQKETALFYDPHGLVIAPNGHLYVADSGNHVIRKINTEGQVSTYAGVAASVGAGGFENGFAASARFNFPKDIVISSNGNLYVTDFFNHIIRVITSNRVVRTYAGIPGQRGGGIGPLLNVRFNMMRGLTIDREDNIFVSDVSFQIRKTNVNGTLALINFAGDLPRPQVGNFLSLSKLASAPNGNLYFTAHNNVIYSMTPEGVVHHFAGDPMDASHVDGSRENATFRFINAMAFGVNGNLYVADCSMIRQITPDGMVSTLAGSAHSGYQDSTPDEIAEASERERARALQRSFERLPIAVPPYFAAVYHDHAVKIHDSEILHRAALGFQKEREFQVTRIREQINRYKRYAQTRVLSEGLRRSVALLDAIQSKYYIPHISDLSLLNQVSYFLKAANHSHAFVPVRRIIELFTNQQQRNRTVPVMNRMLEELVTITASDSIQDLVSEHMIFFSENLRLSVIVSHHYFAKFFLEDNRPIFSDTQISHVYVYQLTRVTRENIHYELLPSPNLAILFNHMPFFRSLITKLENHKLNNLVKLIFPMPNILFERISTAMKLPRVAELALKCVNLEIQENILSCVKELLITDSYLGKNWDAVLITDGALESIFSFFSFGAETVERKSILLLGLAYFFTKLSSSTFLGVDGESPLGFRIFAVGLLNKIHSTTSFYASIADWKNRLTGTDGVFSCTDVLADNILAHVLRDLSPEIFTLVQPPVWQSAR